MSHHLSDIMNIDVDHKVSTYDIIDEILCVCSLYDIMNEIFHVAVSLSSF